MRVYLDTHPLTPGRQPWLCMQPESDADRETLEQLYTTVIYAGFGRDPQSGALTHMEITLEKSP